MEKENGVKTVVPALRFPEFRGMEGWDLKPLNNILDYERPDNYIVETDVYCNEGIPVLTANKSFILGYTKDSNGIYTNLPVVIFDDFTTDKKYVDFPFKVKSSAIKILHAKHTDILRFVYELINQITFEAKEHKRYYISTYQNIQVPIPQKNEQQKIADCLSSLDDLIEATNRKIEALKAHKKGLMQRLFPKEGKNVPELRFPEFQGTKEWEKKKLEEIGNFIGGGTPNTNNPEYWDGEILWYTPTEIKNGRLKSSNRKITEQGLRNSSAKLLPKGAILITTRATIGDVAISEKECTTNQGFQSLVVKDSEVNSFWFYWIIQHKEELNKRASGSTFKEIGKNEIINITAYSTQKQEQQKIADCLSSLDELIEATSRKVEILKEHKKGLMQQLFPKI